MDARNFTFMFYGFLAAWLIVLLYVVSLARRGARVLLACRSATPDAAGGNCSAGQSAGEKFPR